MIEKLSKLTTIKLSEPSVLILKCLEELNKKNGGPNWWARAFVALEIVALALLLIAAIFKSVGLAYISFFMACAAGLIPYTELIFSGVHTFINTKRLPLKSAEDRLNNEKKCLELISLHDESTKNRSIEILNKAEELTSKRMDFIMGSSLNLGIVPLLLTQGLAYGQINKNFTASFFGMNISFYVLTFLITIVLTSMSVKKYNESLSSLSEIFARSKSNCQN